MSVHATAWAWARPEALTPNELIVLIALADFADEDGYAWPSMATLARRCRIHRATVFRILDRLENSHGLLIPVRKRGGRDLSTGQGRSNKYRLNLTKPHYPAELQEGQQLTSDPEFQGSHRATLTLSTGVAPCDTYPDPSVASRDNLSRQTRQVLVAPDAKQPTTEPSITTTHARDERTLRPVGAHGELVEYVTLADGRCLEIPPQPRQGEDKLSEHQQRIALDGVRRIKAQLAAAQQGSQSEVSA